MKNATKKKKLPFYWHNTGMHIKLAKRLQKMIPDSGEVSHPDLNPRLETFRVAQNCYYDLYNNGLCNRAAEFEELFCWLPEQDSKGYYKVDRIPALEAKMDKIIMKAAKEQGIWP